MRLFDDLSGRSPWLFGLAVGGGIGLLSFLSDDFPLPMKLLCAVGSGSFAALRSARRNARTRLNRQQDDARRRRDAAEPSRELPAGRDFRTEMGRRAAILERASPETWSELAPADAPRSDIDRRCEELERSLSSSGRSF